MRHARNPILVVALLLQACGGSTVEFPQVQPTLDVNGSDTVIDITATLAALDRHFDTRGKRAEALSPERIDVLERELPCPLPAPLRAMYGWRDGIEHFVPGYDWLPLDQVVQESKRLRRYADKVSEDGWLRTHLPLGMLDAKEYLLLDCGGSQTIARYFSEDGDRSIRYRGIGHLLAVTLAAYDNGGYRYNGRHLDASPTLVKQAFDRYALDGERRAAEVAWHQLELGLRNASGGRLSMFLQNAQELGDARAVPVLIERLRTAKEEDAAFIANTLGELRAAQALPELDAMLGHASPKIRNFAALSIGRIGAPLPSSTIDKLIALLDDPDDLVKLSAIESIGTSGSPRALEPLIQRLPTSRRGIQFATVYALVELRDKSALTALRQLQADLANADPNEPLKGGTRGADLTPRQLKAVVDQAIGDLGG